MRFTVFQIHHFLITRKETSRQARGGSGIMDIVKKRGIPYGKNNEFDGRTYAIDRDCRR